MLVSIGKAAKRLGVSVSTLRVWDRQGFLQAKYRTKGLHRRYRIDDLDRFDSSKPENTAKLVIGYGRVSSSDQKEDLERQKNSLQQWQNKSQEEPFKLISDLGSGINFKKKGLKKLLNLILHGEVKKLVLCHQDRLLRFGNELIYLRCEHFSIEIELIEEKEAESDEIQLARDVLTIITVFSSRLYGKRGHEKRRARLLAAK